MSIEFQEIFALNHSLKGINLGLWGLYSGRSPKASRLCEMCEDVESKVGFSNGREVSLNLEGKFHVSGVWESKYLLLSVNCWLFPDPEVP